MEGNIKEWTGQSMSTFLSIANDRSRWAAIVVEESVVSTPTTPERHAPPEKLAKLGQNPDMTNLSLPDDLYWVLS